MEGIKVREYDIIMLALARWDADYSSTAYSIASELSKHNRVFYIDNPFTFTDYIRHHSATNIKNRKSALIFGKNFINEIKHNLFAITPRLMIPINWLPPGRIYNGLSKINNNILSKTIEKVVKEFSVEKFIFINSFNPFYTINFPENNKPFLNIYHSVDNIDHAMYIQKHGPRLEHISVTNADFSVVTSTYLKKKISLIANPVFLIPNAADINLFNEAVHNDYERPEELKNINNSIIGYLGNLDQRVDIKLLETIAVENPEKTLLLVGPVQPKYRNKFMVLNNYKNVVFTGKKKYDELPQYIKYINCCIIPFKINDLTRCIYPLKINEYLAAGKPVVTTNFSPDLKAFDKVIIISNSYNEFITGINEGINTDSKNKAQQRILISKSNNWENRVNLLWEIVRKQIKSLT